MTEVEQKSNQDLLRICRTCSFYPVGSHSVYRTDSVGNEGLPTTFGIKVGSTNEMILILMPNGVIRRINYSALKACGVVNIKNSDVVLDD